MQWPEIEAAAGIDTNGCITGGVTNIIGLCYELAECVATAGCAAAGRIKHMKAHVQRNGRNESE